jgi:glycine dehydrogenase subunit 1
MAYTPHTAQDKERMLRQIGVERIEDLYSHIPSSLRGTAALALPAGLTELEVKARMAALAKKNVTPDDWSFFLGGGIYRHFIPSTVDAIISPPSSRPRILPTSPKSARGPCRRFMNSKP